MYNFTDSSCTCVHPIEGSHGRYRLVKDFDYRKLKLPRGVEYMLQGIHITLVNRYRDTLNFWIASKDLDHRHSTVRAFSISNIGGAYCDEGQNYKNLVEFIKELGNNQLAIFVTLCYYDYRFQLSRRKHFWMSCLTKMYH